MLPFQEYRSKVFKPMEKQQDNDYWNYTNTQYFTTLFNRT